jgi:hypothetical protein
MIAAKWEPRTEEFNAAIDRTIRETRRTAASVVEQQSKLTCRDLTKFTPPTGNAPVAESWNDQKRAGEHAIKSDFAFGFQPAGDAKVWDDLFKEPHTRELVRGYFNQWRFEAIKTIMRRMKLRFNLIDKATTALHQKIRNRRGRVTSRGYLVFDVNSVAALLAKKLKNVGMAKSGWAQAATELGVVIPGWIRRHFQPGEIVIDLHGTDHPSVYMSNLSRHANEIEAESNASKSIMQRALNRRADSMNNQMDAMLGKQFEGYKR